MQTYCPKLEFAPLVARVCRRACSRNSVVEIGKILWF